MPQQLPSFFQTMYRVPSASTNDAGSIAPPCAAGHTSGLLPTLVNGPVGLVARATPMQLDVGVDAVR